MNVQVVIQADDGAERKEVCPADGPISVGRHPQCVLCLDSDLVSRQHAVIEAGATMIRVEDVSTNGTLAGDRLLRRQGVEVPYGTPIVVGNFTMYFFPLEDRAGAPAVPPPVPHNAPQNAHQNPHQPAQHAAPQRDPRDARQGRGAQQAAASPSAYPPAVIVQPDAMQVHTKANGAAQRSTTRGPIRGDKLLPTAASPAMSPMELSAALEARRKDVALRRKIHRMLLEHLDLATIDTSKLDDPSMRPKVLTALRRIVEQVSPEIPPELHHDILIGELADEALGLGPLERFLADPSISEVMVVDPNTIYVERAGKIVLSESRFTDDERVRGVIERIVTPLGRRIDESSPIVDARLKDGSRVNAVIRPIALRGSCITIRKFSRNPLTLENLMAFGALTEQMALFLTRSVVAKKNIIISGGTGSGKTTLLNVLSGAIPSDERIVTIEDAAELQLKQPHVVSLETRPANLEGKGEYTIRDLVRNALRMRPDRIVVGECRGGEALDMLQAMNTGHDGSLTTTHANSPMEAIARIETLCLMSGIELPVRAIREQIAGSIHIVVQQARLADGSRKLTAISEVAGINEDTHEIEMRPIFEYVRTGTGAAGKVVGVFRATGYLPTFLDEFLIMGLVQRGEAYL
jgi:pilus assembly protein CpaF